MGVNMSMDWDGLQLNEETGCFSICFSGGEFKNLYAQVRLQDGTCLKTTHEAAYEEGQRGKNRDRRLPQGRIHP